MPALPVWLHETHEPAHATLQHTPSTQKPEAHPSPVVQSAPLGLLPHLPATHWCPAEHWASVVHEEAQRWVVGSQV
jgi:hypothetical protein